MIKLNQLFTVFAAEDLGEPISGLGLYQQDVERKTSTLLGNFLSAIVTTLTVFAGLAFVVYFFIGAIKWITGGGDKGKIEEAKSQMTQAAIGLIAVVASYFIIGIVGGILGIDILNPAKSLGIL
ncbi:hypothetical protein HY333_01585 [Candidatus Collierbacteria bacterium]|nr:hypothetical protein [Candidatus Collierbacteria bacterium]